MNATRLVLVWIILILLPVAFVIVPVGAQEATDEAQATPEETTPGDEAAEPESAPSEEAPADAAENTLGQEVYARRCARCHGDDGQAATRMGERFETRAFTAEMLNELGAEGIAAAVVEGRENMRALTELTDEEMAAMVAYCFSLVQ